MTGTRRTMLPAGLESTPRRFALVDLDLLTRVLVQAARERRAVTYGQLLRYFDRKVTRITVGALCRDLGRIAPRLEVMGAPELACLVVRKADAMPGDGYFLSCIADGAYDGPIQGPPARAFLDRRQEAAFAWAATLADDEAVDSSD